MFTRTCSLLYPGQSGHCRASGGHHTLALLQLPPYRARSVWWRHAADERGTHMRLDKLRVLHGCTVAHTSPPPPERRKVTVHTAAAAARVVLPHPTITRPNVTAKLVSIHTVTVTVAVIVHFPCRHVTFRCVYSSRCCHVFHLPSRRNGNHTSRHVVLQYIICSFVGLHAAHKTAARGCQTDPTPPALQGGIEDNASLV